MHICHLSLDYPTKAGGSGVGTQVHTLSHALIARGYRVTVLALAARGEPEVENDRGVQVRRMRPGNLHWYCTKIPWLGRKIAPALREMEYSWAALRALQRLHAENPVDVVEGTEAGMLGVALWHRLPVLTRLHGEEYTFACHTPGVKVGFPLWSARVLQRMAIRRAGLLVSPSIAHAREIHRELHGRVPYTEIVPNNIPLLPSVDKGPAGKILAGQSVLYVGRLELRKGISILVAAAKRIHEQVPGTRFLFAGLRHSSLPEAQLQQILERSGLNGQIEVLGHIPRQQLPIWYNEASVCVCPSFYETFGLSALEGMAAGVPVVVTDAGAFPEVVEDGLSGIVVKAGDTEALSEAVVRLLRDEELRARIGKAGQERARVSFEVHRQLDDNIRLYRLAVKLWSDSRGADWSSRERIAESQGREIGNGGLPGHGKQVKGEHVFFSPHFDDVSISCGGLIESLRKDGAPVTVITIFTRIPEPDGLSAFTRHLHKKWGLGSSPDELEARRIEDRNSMAALDVKNIEHWNFPDAPYRHAAGKHLYTSYQQLIGKLAPEDEPLLAELSERIAEVAREKEGDVTFYFPAGIGGHVDHQLVHGAGLRLRLNQTGSSEGSRGNLRVRFYEDWPYVETFTVESQAVNPSGKPADWVAQTIEVPLERKLQATLCYRSQFRQPENDLARRFQSYENYWELRGGTAAPGPLADIYRKTPPKASLRDIRKIAARYRWHNLDEILPAGRGICLDFGAGPGVHRSLAESRGYRWVGLDKTTGGPAGAAFVQGMAERSPFASGVADCVIAWQVMEYLEQPERLFAEAARVLATGGVFCGSVSFLEPVHGQTYYGMSPLILERLLGKHGFGDISIKPGVCGFALQTWTWLRRMGGPKLGRLAFPLAAALTAPALCARLAISWLWTRFGRGSGHGMRWVLEKEPLEFAGHVMFVARKIHCI
ncbi:MAG TPA: glycosyltransferase [Bryobacteraceae bacterium]|jgi:hypothetical protein|nr:glycosyltransferase [Bryobacteraceae bacterium]